MPEHIETDDYDNEENDDPGWEEGGDTFPCPYCGEEIYEDAEICPYCGSYIIEQERSPKPTWIVWTALCVLVAFLLVFVFRQ